MRLELKHTQTKNPSHRFRNRFTINRIGRFEGVEPFIIEAYYTLTLGHAIRQLLASAKEFRITAITLDPSVFDKI